MNHSRYMTAGEFARIAGSTKDTLFHYDSIGLFSPQYRADNGYRYYSVEQLDTFDVIHMLRELGMPLSQIGDYLKAKSPEAFLKLLSEEEQVIDQRLRHLKGIKKWIAEKSSQLQTSLSQCQHDISILSLPAQYLVCGYSRESEELELARKVGELYELCEKKGYRSAYNVGYIQTKEAVQQKRFTEYHTVYILFDAPPRRLTWQEREAGSYLCAMHRGHWSSIGETYERLTAYAREHELAIEERFYEDYMMDALTVDTPEDYVTRICVRVHCEK